MGYPNTIVCGILSRWVPISEPRLQGILIGASARVFLDLLDGGWHRKLSVANARTKQRNDGKESDS